MEITWGETHFAIPLTMSTCAVQPIEELRGVWCNGLRSGDAFLPQFFEFSGAVFVIIALIVGTFYMNKFING